MNFEGKYTFSMPTPSGERETDVLFRDYYDGSLHGSVQADMGGADIAKNVKMDGNQISFSAQMGPAVAKITFVVAEDGTFTGTVETAQGKDAPVVTEITGIKSEITDADDRTAEIQMKKKAMILYCSITRNTEKVATWFKETFEHYGMQVTMVKVTNNIDWDQYAGQLYFDDYDVVCMGSPIIGGSPMKAMLKHFSAGAASALEDNVAKNAASGLGFNAGGAGGFKDSDIKGAPGDGAGAPAMPPEPPEGFVDPAAKWGREPVMPYPGGPHYPGRYQPIGIVFTTYGGGFAGSDEALPTLSLLKLYLEDKGAKVIGEFACCGKEFGPAGLDDGVTPRQISTPPVYYKDADGKYHAGGFFFHCHANSKPGNREEVRARAFIADIVEDHFYTCDGKRRTPCSRYLSIS